MIVYGTHFLNQKKGFTVLTEVFDQQIIRHKHTVRNRQKAYYFF